MLKSSIEGRSQIVANSFSRMGSVYLQHRTDRTLLARHDDTFAAIKQNFAVQYDLPTLWLNSAGNQTQHRAFAGAGFTE